MNDDFDNRKMDKQMQQELDRALEMRLAAEAYFKELWKLVNEIPEGSITLKRSRVKLLLDWFIEELAKSNLEIVEEGHPKLKAKNKKTLLIMVESLEKYYGLWQAPPEEDE